MKLAIRYLLYRIFAPHRKGFGVHSPFVYYLDSNVFTRKDDENLKQISVWRNRLLKDRSKILTSDIGSGSRVHISRNRIIKQITRKSSIRHKYGRILYALAREFKPGTIIELGTGIGVSTVYLAKACPGSRVITIDGDGEKMKFAAKELEQMQLGNVSFMQGLFSEVLASVLPSAVHPVMLFVDGDHSYEGTMEYYSQIKKKANHGTLVIFDDIRWSPGMEKAWKEVIKDHKAVLSIDLFFIGIIFFRAGVPKQDFVINF